MKFLEFLEYEYKLKNILHIMRPDGGKETVNVPKWGKSASRDMITSSTWRKIKHIFYLWGSQYRLRKSTVLY